MVEKKLKTKSQKRIKKNKVKIAAKKDLSKNEPKTKSQNKIQNKTTVTAKKDLQINQLLTFLTLGSKVVKKPNNNLLVIPGVNPTSPL